MDNFEIGELVKCFDETTKEYVGYAYIEEYYGDNTAWCYNEDQRINYQFHIEKL